MKFEIYSCILPKDFIGVEFREAASQVYEQMECFLFGIKRKEGSEVKIDLNPDYTIQEDDIGLVFAQSNKQAAEITKLKLIRKE